MVASDVETGRVHAVGADAERMIGRTPATIAATRPLRHGVIADFEVTEEMLRYFIRKVLDRRMAHPRLIVCAPSGVTEVEKRAVEEASLAAGARRVHLIEEPIAAAIGAGHRDRGADRADGGRRRRRDQRDGGDLARRDRRVTLDPGRRLRDGRRDRRTTCASCTSWRSARRPPSGSRSRSARRCRRIPRSTMEVRGRHLVTGLPTAVQLSSGEVRAAIAAPLSEILQAIRDTLEETPPELASDIARDGILLAGGGTLIRGFDDLVARRDRDAGVLGRVSADLRRLRVRPGARPSRQAEPDQPLPGPGPHAGLAHQLAGRPARAPADASAHGGEQDQERVDRLAEPRRLGVDERDAQPQQHRHRPQPPRAPRATARVNAPASASRQRIQKLTTPISAVWRGRSIAAADALPGERALELEQPQAVVVSDRERRERMVADVVEAPGSARREESAGSVRRSAGGSASARRGSRRRAATCTGPAGTAAEAAVVGSDAA